MMLTVIFLSLLAGWKQRNCQTIKHHGFFLIRGVGHFNFTVVNKLTVSFFLFFNLHLKKIKLVQSLLLCFTSFFSFTKNWVTLKSIQRNQIKGFPYLEIIQVMVKFMAKKLEKSERNWVNKSLILIWFYQKYSTQEKLQGKANIYSFSGKIMRKKSRLYFYDFCLISSFKGAKLRWKTETLSGKDSNNVLVFFEQWDS